MKISDGFVVSARIMTELMRQGVDAGRTPLGRALPLRPERAADPATLQRLLDAYSLDPAVAAGRLEGVRRLSVESVSSNCNNILLALEWEGRRDAALPASAFLKLPSTQLATRVFCNLIRIWRLECRFYQNVADKVPIRIPRAYAAGDRSSRFFLLLEDLHADPMVKLHTNPDLLVGADIDLARRCLTTLATLHASFWGTPASERDALLEPDLHPLASHRARPINLVINELAIAPCRRRAPDVMTDDLVSLFRNAIARFEDLCRFWYREPLTLIHGDSHLGNFFLSESSPGMLDWQAAMWAKGIRDVQYFLINSVPEDVLAQDERALLDHYLAELARNGVELSTEEAWSQYRGYSFQTLMTHVVSLGLGPLTEAQAVMKVLLARAAAAIRRVGFADWLSELDRGDGHPEGGSLVERG